MTVERNADLQDFLDALEVAFAAAAKPESQVRAFLAELVPALAAPAAKGNGRPARLPVCDHLPAAFQAARSASPEIARLSSALEKIAPLLAWKARPSGGPHSSANWPEGHANATIVGIGGLEERRDVAVGASLLAPQVRYPDHNHPPEELYMIMTPGRFQHGDGSWCEPGPGGTFHNVPGIKHAMASGDGPLLAIWTMVIR